MKRIILCVLTVLCPFINILTQPVESDDVLRITPLEGPKPWTGQDVNNNPDQFQFLIVTDRTGGHRDGVFEDAIKKINLLQPEFVMCVGDMIEGYTEDTSILAAEWDEFNGFVDALEMPFFYVPGNHDLTNPVMEQVYIKRFGKTYYHFTYKDVLFLCLNSEDQLRGAGAGTISKDQYEYIENVLDENADVRYTFVFLHQPLWIQDDPKYWPQVETLLSGRKHTVFAGHYHHYVKRNRNDGKYVMLATTGGGSRLRGSQFGEFDHVAWVTMTEDEPIMANLGLKGIWDENISTEASETYISDLLSSRLIEIEPEFYSDSIFTSGTFDMKIRNDQDIPLHLEIQEGFGWDVWVTVAEHELDLPPNSVTMVQGRFETRNGQQDIRRFRSTPIHFKVTSEVAGHGEIEIPFHYNLKPHLKRYIKMASEPVMVNGKTDDWDNLTDGFDNQGDVINFGVSYDKDFLYLVAHVKDQTILVDTSQSASRQDCIGLQLAFQPVIKSAKSPSSSYTIRMTPSANGLPSLISPGSIPDDWKMICQPDNDGYTFEMAVPASYIKSVQGEDWKNVRINWYVDDLDQPDHWQEMERCWYQDPWGSADEILGSGFFFRGTH